MDKDRNNHPVDAHSEAVTEFINSNPISPELRSVVREMIKAREGLPKELTPAMVKDWQEKFWDVLGKHLIRHGSQNHLEIASAVREYEHSGLGIYNPNYEAKIRRSFDPDEIVREATDPQLRKKISQIAINRVFEEIDPKYHDTIRHLLAIRDFNLDLSPEETVVWRTKRLRLLTEQGLDRKEKIIIATYIRKIESESVIDRSQLQITDNDPFENL